MKTIAVFGSTGSIGEQTLNIVRRYPEKFKVVALTGGSNTALLARQVEEFKPSYVGALCSSDSFGSAKCFFGEDAALKVAEHSDADIAVMAITGLAALKPLAVCLKKGKRVAMANKEAIVCAGELLLRIAKESGSVIIPVDSEHSAIFRCLGVGNRADVKRLILTASGGPFYGATKEKLCSVTPEQAAQHPTWKMGTKISVDSATMVNKGLEIIEASRLFEIDCVDYVIHPESIIHSMVELVDGSCYAQMSYPNMELAIQYAITFPDCAPCDNVKPFDFSKSLSFLAPDERLFPAPMLARECLRLGGAYPALYSIADEIAVKLFLDKKISFTNIYKILEYTINKHRFMPLNSFDELYELERKLKIEIMSGKQ